MTQMSNVSRSGTLSTPNSRPLFGLLSPMLWTLFVGYWSTFSQKFRHPKEQTNAENPAKNPPLQVWHHVHATGFWLLQIWGAVHVGRNKVTSPVAALDFFGPTHFSLSGRVLPWLPTSLLASCGATSNCKSNPTAQDWFSLLFLSFAVISEGTYFFKSCHALSKVWVPAVTGIWFKPCTWTRVTLG